jgi:hypothetical protein
VPDEGREQGDDVSGKCRGKPDRSEHHRHAARIDAARFRADNRRDEGVTDHECR